ncbi:MAG: phosphoglucosamine mutase [Verrucomicrobia bacterium]|nr:MAG: phosphoglucosamine mutase [Verrucomicrobiota bacterium]
MAPIKFGTDGWRAVIAEDFTFTNVERVAQAVADYWASNPVEGTEKKVIVGYDRRFLSDAFGQRTAEVLAGNGFQVILCPQPAPTPSISFAVKAERAVGGVMITASHNPAIFNGFKLKSYYGGSADASTCHAVETHLDRSPIQATSLAAGTKEGRIALRDVRPEHFAALKRLVDFKLIAKSKLRFAHEALFGVGAGCFEQLLAGTTCRVTTLNGAHDPLFGGINPEPIEKNYARSSAFLKKHPHDICLVTDGDADRVGGMDGRGRYLSTHQIICMLLRHFVVNRGEEGGRPCPRESERGRLRPGGLLDEPPDKRTKASVLRKMVKALTTTSMVDKMCSAYGLELVETGVGFKYIVAEMLKGGVLLGAEESGGIAFPGHIPERDGIAAGLMLLEMLATERVPVNKLIARLEKEFGPHRYGRIDTHFPLEKRGALMEFLKQNPPSKLLRSPLAAVKSYDGVKFIAQDTSWLMLRGSGTEPILRIYAEAKTDADARKLLGLGLRLTKQV